MFDRLIRYGIKNQEEKLERFLARHEKENPFPDGVALTADIAYADDTDPRHTMDIFRPEGASGKLPVMFNIHGGGFLLGKKEVNRLFCADFCRRGFLVFAAEYPLAPDADIFTILRSLAAAMKKAGEIAGTYGGDSEKFFLSGDSAGAWLAVYLAAMQKSAALAGAAGVDLSGTPRVYALGLQSGMFYTRKPDNIGMFVPPLIYGKGYKKRPFAPYTDPEHREIVGNLPPAFLVTGRGDFLRHYSRRYAKVLSAASVPSEFLDMENAGKLAHAFPAILPEFPASKTANDAMASFFFRSIKG
ncbi:MAG TPA: alpha/beta hydrolase [Clostridiales bacterium]|nr:alpha/beta hydrolase [Clostridiales bacterium]